MGAAKLWTSGPGCRLAIAIFIVAVEFAGTDMSWSRKPSAAIEILLPGHAGMTALPNWSEFTYCKRPLTSIRAFGIAAPV
jgi:hypothetical protein